MENHEISRIFSDIADILEIKGENIFKVNAYRKGARIVEELPQSLKEKLSEEAFEEIPGIGKALAEKIVEMLKTGKCQYFEELLQEPVAQVIELTRISDVGPKKAKLFYEALGVMTVDQLEAEAKAGNIAKLPGMGKIMEDKILRRIIQYREHTSRFRLNEATEIANLIVADLRKKKFVKRAEIAGSLRRGKETVGDLDILTTSSDPEKVLNYFTELPYVTEILGKGPTKASVRLQWKIQCDLRVLPEEDFGAGLMYFTGSKEHNVALRRIAIEKGYKLSEYGLFKGEKEINASHGCSEADIYKMLGLAFVEPQMRENHGEVELALHQSRGSGAGRLAQALPKLIELGDIKGDLHDHTTESDGRASLEQMIEAATAMKYEYLAITDHSKSLRVARGLDTMRALAEIKAIRAFNKSQSDIHIFTGTEVDILEDGSLDHDEEVLAQMDIVVASVHTLFNLSEAEQTARVMKALENPYITILGHPTGRLINQREPYAINIEKIIQHAIAHHVVLEINASPERLDLKDTHIQFAKKLGAKFSIATDSHTTASLNQMMYGITTARRGWVEKGDVMNTMTLKQLLAFLKKQRELKSV